MKKWLFTILGLVLCVCLNAQGIVVRGTVKGESSGSTIRTFPLPGTIVQIFHQNGESVDSLYTTTDREGQFYFKNIKSTNVRLRARMLGYVTHESVYELDEGVNAIFIELKKESIALKESKVSAEMQLMKQVKDTTIFSAAAVRTGADESARAILEQLPGFSVSENNITVDGQQVKKTYVNGVLVFGNSPITAVDALKADEVKEIRVYEEMEAEDKVRGLKNSRKEKVLDIRTKESILSLTQINLTQKGGADESKTIREHAGASMTFNSEMANASVVLYSSNMSTFGGAIADIHSAIIFAQAPTFTSPLTNNDRHSGLYLNGAKYWKDRNYGNSLDVTYSFMHSTQKSAERALTEYFATPSSPQMNYYDTTSTSSLSRTHTIMLKTSFKDTAIKNIDLNVTARISDKYSDNFSAQRIVKADAEDIYSRVDRGRKNKDKELSGILTWTNPYTGGIKPTFSFDWNTGTGSGDSWTLDTLASSHTKRQLQSDHIGNYANARARMSVDAVVVNSEEKTVRVQAEMRANYDHHKNRQMTYDMYGVEVPLVDIGSSYDYNWNQMDYVLDLGVNYSSKEGSFSISLPTTYSSIIDRESYPSVRAADRGYWMFTPSGSFYIKTDKVTFQTSVHSYSTLPSLEQSRDQISDTNPLSLTGGNPNLKKGLSTSWANILVLSSAKRKTFKSVLALTAQVSTNQIVTKTTYFSTDTVLPEWDNYQAKAGAMLHTFENSTRPHYHFDIRNDFSDIFFSRKLNISLSPNLMYSKSYQYAGEDMIGLKDYHANINSSGMWRPNKSSSVMLSMFGGWNQSINDSGEKMLESISANSRVTATQSLWKNRIKITGTYQLRFDDYLSSDRPNNVFQFLCFNAQYKAFKGQLTVSFEAGDLLNAGTDYLAYQTPLYYQQNWTPSYGRFYLLRVNYSFRRKGSSR
ncbi:MAG: carboxypeptidase regulatory-like domain-containing protein [Bacteroidales bacterium]|nr:carboxypeptidase regulatory-like domain-containing protein [Bacteroidales bacterium]